jgi:hypothetical protein
MKAVAETRSIRVVGALAQRPARSSRVNGALDKVDAKIAAFKRARAPRRPAARTS